jgi:ketosteroid isomerase-like protein
MSQENVELVRRVYDAYLRGDAATALSAFDPEIEWDARHHPDGHVYHGHEGVQQFILGWLSTWETFETEIEDYLDADDDVVVLTRETGRLKGSGLEVSARHAEIYTLRDGKVVRWRAFADQRDALEAVGLREQA